MEQPVGPGGGPACSSRLLLHRVTHVIGVKLTAVLVATGGGPDGDGGEATGAGHVSILQQAQEQILLPVGPGHYLKEKDKGSPQYQPGSKAPSTFNVALETA